MSMRELYLREVANPPEALQREAFDFARFLRMKDAEALQRICSRASLH